MQAKLERAQEQAQRETQRADSAAAAAAAAGAAAAAEVTTLKSEAAALKESKRELEARLQQTEAGFYTRPHFSTTSALSVG